MEEIVILFVSAIVIEIVIATALYLLWRSGREARPLNVIRPAELQRILKRRQIAGAVSGGVWLSTLPYLYWHAAAND
jgi:hypothetical protein